MSTSFLLPLLALVPFLGTPQDPWPAPDPELQRGFERVLASATPDERAAAFAFLRANAGARHERLVPQLMLWSERSRETDTGLLPGIVHAELAIPAEDVVAALVPLLASEDPARRAALGRVLSEHEDHDLLRGADFSLYRPWLRPEAAPAPGLVRHLFATDPDAALLTLLLAQVADASEQRALLLAQHELADLRWRLRHGFLARATLERDAPSALAALTELATHSRPFARLAAATLALEEPTLRGPARLELLTEDPDPLVRATARAAR
jgi:hypothetical protein